MKIAVYPALLICMLTFFSCSDDTPTNSNVNTPFVQGYDNNESAICMTLAKIAYVDQNTPQYIRDSVMVHLANTKYATGGNWKLAWGPGLNSDFSNMMYVAKDTTTEPDSYAVAIRGTDWCYFLDWKEDFTPLEFVSYPYGSSTDSVSYGAMYGLNQLLSMRDPVSNQTLISYLNSIQSQSNRMFITGHSLGGQLATIMSSWFLDNGYGSRFALKSYTYAAPSTGNEDYVNHFEQIFSAANAESHRVVNSNDLVPNFCATLDDVLINQIPTNLPKYADGIIFGLQVALKKEDLIYKNVGIKYDLGTLTPDSCNFPPGTLDQYACWVAFEHDSDNYLKLVNAPPVDLYYAPCGFK